MVKDHHYAIQMKWTGNTGEGTADGRSYERSYTLYAEGKEDISGSADPSSLGDPKKWNPEELLLGSLASCYMLWYLYLCAVSKIVVVSYTDEPQGVVAFDSDNRGAFSKATLNPKVMISDPSRIEEARKNHQKAHDKCFIANSVNFEILLNPSTLF